MSRKVIPLLDQRRLTAVSKPPLATHWVERQGPLLDTLQRPLKDLRISVTDRCNFRCRYCMPREVFDSQHVFLPQAELLSFEEITRLARVFVSLGTEKIRLTGGEPLLRKHLETLVGALSGLSTPAGRPLDLTLTTNGSLLARKAAALRQAGLQRITVSLDALDDAIFRQMNDADFGVADVLDGIAAAQEAGLSPLKVNMVVQRGVNDDQILPMARHFRGRGVVLRFIEYMDVGSTNGWNLEQVLPSSEVLRRLGTEFEMAPVSASAPGETATRWAYADGAGEIGLISSVTQAFCGDCTRARLSTEGQLYLCLFAHQGHDLRALVRGGHGDAEVKAALASWWTERADRYSAQRSSAGNGSGDEPGPPRVEMHYIGG
ncbi:MAG: GTP 3',8-cyclase MoaA [Pseudomonadota bacterium]